MRYEKIMKQLKSFNFTNAQRKKLASIILKLDKEKQDILISGDNIATINGQSLLNGGNISLIKTGIFSIVTELPTNDIDKDKVYLVPSTETDLLRALPVLCWNMLPIVVHTQFEGTFS